MNSLMNSLWSYIFGDEDRTTTSKKAHLWLQIDKDTDINDTAKIACGQTCGNDFSFYFSDIGITEANKCKKCLKYEIKHKKPIRIVKRVKLQ